MLKVKTTISSLDIEKRLCQKRHESIHQDCGELDPSVDDGRRHHQQGHLSTHQDMSGLDSPPTPCKRPRQKGRRSTQQGGDKLDELSLLHCQSTLRSCDRQAPKKSAMRPSPRQSKHSKCLTWQSGPKLLDYQDGSVLASNDPRLCEGLVDESCPNKYHTVTHSKPKRIVPTGYAQFIARFEHTSNDDLEGSVHTSVPVSQGSRFADISRLSESIAERSQGTKVWIRAKLYNLEL